jgi:anti-sigma factor RsiW
VADAHSSIIASTMNSLTCHGDWLVDYADDELSGQQLAAAERHVAACPACRRELTALQASDAKLNAYFSEIRNPRGRESLAKNDLQPARSPRSPKTPDPLTLRSISRRTLVAAACIAVIALGLAYSRPKPSASPTTHVVERAAPTEPADEDPLAEINRQTQIARLRAAIAILKEEPAMEERSKSLEQYLSDAYHVDASL